MAVLKLQAPGEAKAKLYRLTKRLYSIGSGPDNDIHINDPQIKAEHALLQSDGRAFVIRSFPDADPILANGRPTRRHLLKEGDELMIGETIGTYSEQEESEEPPKPAYSNSKNHEAPFLKLLALAESLLANTESESLLDEIMDSIIELTNAEKGFIVIKDGDSLTVPVARGTAQAELNDPLGAYSDSIVQAVLRDGQPLRIADATHDPSFNASASVQALKLSSIICVPLRIDNEISGVAYIGNSNLINHFRDFHLESVTIFAAFASLIISQAHRFQLLRADVKMLRDALDSAKFGSLIGVSDSMKEVYRKVDRVAATDVSVLILGETGTGKELIAREIHRRSDRSDGPFVTINCGAIPENLLESELFGYVKGAFTGAHATRDGRFQAAHGGTLFLDEVGEMPTSLQVKILRALQERTVTRIGDTRPEPVDIRILAATHRDLQRAITDQTFREDLYYRLNVVSVELPPLRTRGDDVLLLAQFFLDRFSKEYATGPKTLSKEAKIALRRAAWPGNIRQLENHLRKAVILSEAKVIEEDDLGLGEDAEQRLLPLHEARELWQRGYIKDALLLNGGNRTQTARELGVDPRTIFRFLEREQSENPE